ncbi:PREDICTED: BEL1-like homeodomain protein 5 [Tarenaya hassleriana]|uniref:BEL1-like homeodomain protein 5 n=1 Tax=Tarenaya hassleriana TaxID=28532 RepID=UPI00053C2087|nr:PREDICTED: BEL1-like homeodomain protein 5 [Tarenaya hassleriana]XP_010544330.1 PREDICTED: BEL1-like homeodomain protein 5 [Tarenaya hassleriana]
MAAFFHEPSQAREDSSSSSEFALQHHQHSLRLMNALDHAPPSLSVDVSTCTPHHFYYNGNSCFGSPVDPDPDPIRDVIKPDPGGSQGFELLPRLPLPAVSPGNGKKLSLGLSSRQTQTRTRTTIGHVEQGNSAVSTVTNGVVFSATGNGFDPMYLKAAHELLNEIVSVGNAKNSDCDGSKGKLTVKTEFSGDGFAGSGYRGGIPIGGELTATNRQELQMKKAKLVSMVEEVEQRYMHYRDQMQAIVSSFEQAGGFTAAKSYTSLALPTISKQFRVLKDAVRTQIKIISKCLGEEYTKKTVREGCGFVDQTQQLRHLGIMQKHHHANAWRPQRGLPERAVSILRAWLYEHFLHPYPKDMDKQMLAKQTGLTRSQVSNWFINARVRLWKPMVEEMYSEEMKVQANAKNDTTNEEDNDDLELGVSSSKQPRNHDSSDQSIPGNSNLKNNKNVAGQCSSLNVSSSTLAAASHHQGGILSRPKKLRTMENDFDVMQNSSIVSYETERKQQMDHPARESGNLIHFNGGFGNYRQAMYGKAVSLSLGPPHSRDQTFNDVFETSHQIEFSGVSPLSTYQNIDIPGKRRFVTNAAPLLPDFFA